MFLIWEALMLGDYLRSKEYGMADENTRYQMPHQYDSSKPTLVLVNSFTTSSELYQGQFSNRELTDAMNLIAIE